MIKVQVLVRLKSGVLDVQGKAVEHGLNDNKLSGVRVGKLIELSVDTPDFESAKKYVSELCETVLTNPIMEVYEIRQAA